MNAALHIDLALIRCGSPYKATDLFGWLREGRATLALADEMSGSVWYPDENTAEIAHIGGRWNDDDALWLYDRLQESLALHGVTTWRWSGRKGWARFLKRKGWL